MGDGGQPLRRFHAPHRHRLGWLNPASVVSEPRGVITLTSASRSTPATTSPVLLRFTRNNVEYQVSLRTQTTAAQGYDSTLQSQWAGKLYVHRVLFSVLVLQVRSNPPAPCLLREALVL